MSQTARPEVPAGHHHQAKTKMNPLLRNLLGKAPQTKSARQQRDSAAGSLVSTEDGPDNATRRKLLLVLLRDVLSRHGIPQDWIDLHILAVNSASRGPGIYIRLVLKHWDARLLNYAQAFQNELLIDIGRFESNASEWLHGISWQLEMTASCPYTTVPDKAFWDEPAQDQGPDAPLVQVTGAANATPPLKTTPVNSAMEDVNRVFLARDREISHAAENSSPPEYEKTWPVPL